MIGRAWKATEALRIPEVLQWLVDFPSKECPAQLDVPVTSVVAAPNECSTRVHLVRYVLFDYTSLHI